MARKKKLDQWAVLSDKIVAYADARVADHEKGGGDPLDYETIEIRLELARAELNAHINQIRRNYE